MTGYIVEFQGHGQFDPNGKCAVPNVQKHNAKLASDELKVWAQAPDRWQVYIVQRKDERYRESPCSDKPMTWYMAETFTGERLSDGRVEVSRFRTNISRNMVSVRFKGTNGATYYGRYGADWSQLCRVRKAKGEGI